MHIINSLQSIMDSEAGVVIYPTGDAIICNWARIEVIPRLFLMGGNLICKEVEVVEEGFCDDIKGKIRKVTFDQKNYFKRLKGGRQYSIRSDDIEILKAFPLTEWN